MNAHDTLARIRDRLSDHTPQQVIAEFVPSSLPAAVSWGRHLPVWDEHSESFPPQVLAVARIVSRQAMKRFGLVMDEEGRVVTAREARPRWQTGEKDVLVLEVDGQPVNVEYVRRYCLDRDHFQFTGTGNQPQPHPLSPTGHWSHFADPDGVIALSGPERYATHYAAAMAAGREKEFIGELEGKRPEKEAPQTAVERVRRAEPRAGQSLF